MHFAKGFVAILFFITSQLNSFSQTVDSFTKRQFSIEELQVDFKAMRNRYEDELANLYLYTSKEELNKLFDSLYENIHSMTAQEFYNYITPLSSAIKDGHSNIFPGEEATDYHSQYSKFFPFNIYWSEDKMFIAMNLSSDTTIQEGTEILSINGMSSKDLMDYLLNRQVRDGNNENYAVWILNNYFREYYSYQFGHPENFLMRILNTDSSVQMVTVSALNKKIISENRVKRYSYLKAEVKRQQDFSFEIDNAKNTAILTIRTWDNKNLKNEIDNAFAQIEKSKIGNLIIDVRDNQGGNFSPAIYLLSYLLHQPFYYFNELKSVVGSTDTSQLLKKENGRMLGIHRVKKNNYTGNVFVLINGGSFSNTAAFCSRIEFYKRGIFIGEESGGNKSVFSGEFGVKRKTVLPNTKIICENANFQMTVTDISSNTGHGVLANFFATPTIDDLIQNRDAVLDEVLELIMRGR